MVSFVTLVAALATAFGFGAIIAAIVGHWTAISNHRQAWINALRDDIAEFFRATDEMYYVFGDYTKNSTKAEGKMRAAKLAVRLVHERIRLRLNMEEKKHGKLEAKLGEFLNEPLPDMLENSEGNYDRQKIDEAINLARKVLKREWEVAKHPIKSYCKKKKNKMMEFYRRRFHMVRVWLDTCRKRFSPTGHKG